MLYLRETGEISTAVIALEILSHVFCRIMNCISLLLFKNTILFGLLKQ